MVVENLDLLGVVFVGDYAVASRLFTWNPYLKDPSGARNSVSASLET